MDLADVIADIILQLKFEKGIVKLFCEELNSLSASELEAIDVLLETRDNSETDDASISLASRVLNKQRTEMGQKYFDAKFSRPTLNICKQIFSKAGNALFPGRKKTDSRSFESQNFLRVNNCLWNANDVAHILKKHSFLTDSILNYLYY